VKAKDVIAYSHYTALNGSWLYDEESCMAMKVIEPATLAGVRPQESKGGYELRQGDKVLQSFAPAERGKVDETGFRVFIVDDLAHEGRFKTVADPWFAPFVDGRFLEGGPFVLELEQKLSATHRYERVAGDDWLRAVMALPPELVSQVLSDQRKADCPADYWSVGGIMGSSRRSTLAGWMDLWFGAEWVWICPDCGARVFVSWGCAGLSMGSLTGLCSGCGETIVDRYGPAGKIARALGVLRRHRPSGQGKRPFRIDTVLSLVDAPVQPGRPDFKERKA